MTPDPKLGGSVEELVEKVARNLVFTATNKDEGRNAGRNFRASLIALVRAVVREEMRPIERMAESARDIALRVAAGEYEGE